MPGVLAPHSGHRCFSFAVHGKEVSDIHVDVRDYAPLCNGYGLSQHPWHCLVQTSGSSSEMAEHFLNGKMLVSKRTSSA